MRQELAVAIQNAHAYRQLQDARAELERTDEMKSEFIALSSHNLRTPITTIKLITDFLHTSKLPPEVNHYVESLSGVSEQLGDFVEELIAISTLEAGERYQSLEVMTAEDLLQPLAAQIEPVVAAKGVKVQLSFQQPHLSFRADSAHLRIVFRNLLDNAAKFTKSGNITVAVTAEGDKCAIRVTDTGVGIQPEELKHLFTKFHRGTSYMRYDYTGAGLGLYLAKLVVEKHGGTISVKSQLQAGTTVAVLLPLAKAGNQPTSANPASSNP
jgi:signal transduction histidine kinase